MVAFLWTGSDMVQRGKCLVAWDRVQRPLHLRSWGLGSPTAWNRAENVLALVVAHGPGTPLGILAYCRGQADYHLLQ
jgi:hypothetical protein